MTSTGIDGARLLLVEDDTDLRVSIAASLVAHGYSVRQAGTAGEGLAAWASNRPDLVPLSPEGAPRAASVTPMPALAPLPARRDRLRW